MSDSGARIVLLPEKRCFSGQRLSERFSHYSRRFKIQICEAGEVNQLKRYFKCIPEGSWPIAALCRQLQVGDAAAFTWLRADPIYLQAEMRGARVMSCSDFSLTADDINEVVSALNPAFNDHGFRLSADGAGVIYIQCPEETQLPAFLSVMDLLGHDLAGQLPTERLWTALLNECQITLHNHPLNVRRQRNGLLPVNGLWFWGGGTLPSVVIHSFKSINTEDKILLALSGNSQAERGSDILCDLRHIRKWDDVESRFDAGHGAIFDFADGTQWHWMPSWQMHFWRRKSIPVF